ncbi:methyltransferase domain-containing protein [uncultured Jatrophihabitans sp.]|uniref:class I SAM-dependent methyltransferase n=1 Tax=uncultured Jatrophihabitans sp. TaxID=1610747 RepID=UPI0035CB45F7
MRLNLGSGHSAIDGWTSIDRSPSIFLDRIPGSKRLLRSLHVIDDSQAKRWDPAVIRADIRRLPYADATVDAIYSSHALEHLYFDDARAVLVESYRVLRPGGVIRLALPDCESHARELVDALAGNASSADAALAVRVYNEKLLAFPSAKPRGLDAVKRAVGGHIHRWQPMYPLVRSMLEEIGFASVTRCVFQEGRTPNLRDIETRAESFFVEGEKA